jgi:hypothetical protein
MTNPLTTRVRRFVILVAALLIIGAVVNYLWGVNSDAMGFADARIRESAAVRQRVGEVTDVRLKFLGYGNKSGFDNDRSELRLRVEGTDGSMDLELKLEGRDDSWRILDSSIAF